MKTQLISKLTGVALVAAGMTFAPLTYNAVQAQDSEATTETFEAEPATPISPGQTLGAPAESLEQAGQEAVRDVEAAGTAAQQQIDQSVQEAIQAAQENSQAAVASAEEAAQRAELAAREAVSVEQNANWGWLGLLGLLGLFGLTGRHQRRVENDDRYYRDRVATPSHPSTAPSSTTTEYRS